MCVYPSNFQVWANRTPCKNQRHSPSCCRNSSSELQNSHSRAAQFRPTHASARHLVKSPQQNRIAPRVGAGGAFNHQFTPTMLTSENAYDPDIGNCSFAQLCPPTPARAAAPDQLQPQAPAANTHDCCARSPSDDRRAARQRSKRIGGNKKKDGRQPQPRRQNICENKAHKQRERRDDAHHQRNPERDPQSPR